MIRTTATQTPIQKKSSTSQSPSKPIKIATIQEAKAYNTYSVVTSDSTVLYKPRTITIKKTILR